jgi:hypothetical protein
MLFTSTHTPRVWERAGLAQRKRNTMAVENTARSLFLRGTWVKKKRLRNTRFTSLEGFFSIFL